MQWSQRPPGPSDTRIKCRCPRKCPELASGTHSVEAPSALGRLLDSSGLPPPGRLPTYLKAMKTPAALCAQEMFKPSPPPLDSSPVSDLSCLLFISIGRREALPPNLCQVCALPPDVHRRGGDVPHRSASLSVCKAVLCGHDCEGETVSFHFSFSLLLACPQHCNYFALSGWFGKVAGVANMK